MIAAGVSLDRLAIRKADLDHPLYFLHAAANRMLWLLSRSCFLHGSLLAFISILFYLDFVDI